MANRSPVLVRALLAAVALVVSCRPAAAGDGDSFAVGQPLKKGQKTSGLTAIFDGWGWSGSGYREVALQINSVPPAPRDRTLDLQVALNSYLRSYTPFAVSKNVTIPKGHTTSTVNMLIPQHSAWHYLRVDVLEDGKRLPDLSMDRGRTIPRNNTSGGSPSEAYPTMLFVDKDAPRLFEKNAVIADRRINRRRKITHDLPEIRALAMLVHPGYSGGAGVEAIQQTIVDSKKKLPRGSDLETLELVQDLDQWELLPPEDLPDSWLGLTSVDLVFVSLDDLKQTLQQTSDKFQELLRYISTGATLVVHGCGDEFSRIDELTDILEYAPAATSSWHDLAGSIESVESDVLAEESRAMWDTILDQAQAQYGGFPDGKLGSFTGTLTSMPAAPPPVPQFRLQQLGLGTVIAVAGSEPFYGQAKHWHWLFGRLSPNRWMWYRRHGLSRHRNNDDFWNFLIPGIGAAPVKSFLVMITGFAVLVGPVTYWLLRQFRKLYLLLAVVPTAAAVLTGGMFFYVLFHDGLTTRMRCRSFSRIDQQNQTTVSWSRQSYYCGLAPSDGVRFPASAAVFPIDYQPHESSTRRRIRWHDKHQVLTRGYLRSRTLSQFLVIHAHSTTLRVDIRRRVASGVLEVENRLDVPVDRLIICDDDSQLHLVEDLPASGKAAASPASVVEVSRALEPFLKQTSPRLPDKFDVDYHTRSFAFNTSYGWSMDRSFSDPSQETSVLETNLRWLELRDPLPRRTFWAVTSQVPGCVPVGVVPCEEIASCHVVQGDW